MTEQEYQQLLKRVRAKLSKSHIPAVARETGKNDSNLRRIASGMHKRPRYQYVEDLAEYFGISLSDNGGK